MILNGVAGKSLCNKSDPPPPPDYEAAARATAAGNLETAKYTTEANRVNQITPYGNLTYNKLPTFNQGAYDTAMAKYNADLANYNQSLQDYNTRPANNFGGMGALSLGNLNSLNLTGGYNPSSAPTSPIAPTKDSFTTADKWEAVQTLTPAQQEILNKNNALNSSLLSTAQTGLNYANKVLSKPGVDLSKLPSIASSVGTNLPSMTSGVSSGQLATNYDVQNAIGKIDKYGQIQNSIDTSGLPSYGINPGETYSDAIMRRLQPDLERQRAAEETRLANQGIGLGSNAYSTAQDILGRQQNDAMTSAIVQGMQTGLTANQQQFNQNAAQQAASNAAQAQGYGQNVTAAQFANQAAAQNTNNAANLAAFQNQSVGQQFNQGLANAQLSNQANLQTYNQQLQNAQLQNAAQQQGFTQEAYNQMQPINVINAIRTGTQVQNPTYANVPLQAQVAGPDLLGATQSNYNAQLGAVNAQNAASGNFMGGLMNAGATIAASDINLKENIKRIGTHDLGIGIYSYNYKDGYDLPENMQIGVMAQEVETVMPEAVVIMPNGFKAVNYSMLGA